VLTAESLQVSGLLLDCDGVLVDSIALSDLVFREWAKRNNVDFELMSRRVHGRRLADALKELVPDTAIEAAINTIAAEELALARLTKPCAGAVALAQSVTRSHIPWGVVTSAGRSLALARLTASGVGEPPVLVAAEDVASGKPSPEGFMLAASLLGVEPDECLAIDDREVGIAAANAAGMSALFLSPTPSPLALGVLDSLTDLSCTFTDGRLQVHWGRDQENGSR
jgi:sugar-phosphatase